MSEPLRILLADDHVLFRRGVASVLAPHPAFDVVGEASDGLEAVALARETRPDLIVMDIGMPRLDGLEAVRRIKHDMPQVKTLVLTVSDDDADLFEAIKSGAQGYLVKDLKQHQLFDAIDAVSRGEASFSSAVAARILQELQEPARDEAQEPEMAEPLTDREREVLELMVQGLSNNEIGEALCIAGGTVKNHVSHILGKLHLQNRVQAAVHAVREGLVREPGEME
ncbi:MAG: response regulator transcription factor [Chloroflexota bacterium]|nr:response regulator transcription factor [Chloroflexota bacterium]